MQKNLSLCISSQFAWSWNTFLVILSLCFRRQLTDELLWTRSERKWGKKAEAQAHNFSCFCLRNTGGDWIVFLFPSWKRPRKMFSFFPQSLAGQGSTLFPDHFNGSVLSTLFQGWTTFEGQVGANRGKSRVNQDTTPSTPGASRGKCCQKWLSKMDLLCVYWESNCSWSVLFHGLEHIDPKTYHHQFLTRPPPHFCQFPESGEAWTVPSRPWETPWSCLEKKCRKNCQKKSQAIHSSLVKRGNGMSMQCTADGKFSFSPLFWLALARSLIPSQVKEGGSA